MIRNVIFDMGNVLLRWDPRYIVEQFAGDAGDQALLRRAIFEQPDWPMLDAGSISEADMLAHIRARLPERLHAAAERCFCGYERHMPDIPEMQALAEELKRAGYRIYLLSNAGVRFRKYLQSRPFFRDMDGIVISAEEKRVKPDVQLFRLMLDRYGLSAGECVFIDDMPVNLTGAREAGMEALHFDGNAAALREKMRRIGVKSGTGK